MEAGLLARFSEALLQLYRDARSPADNDFAARAFESIKTFIPCDSGWWAVGVVDLDPAVEYAGAANL